MALLQSDEPNLIDAETPNWRAVVYPILAGLVIVLGGLGYYFYQQNQRNQAESDARAALLKSNTPAEYRTVAERYPHTTQATLALLAAANSSFAKHDFDGALADYHKVTSNASVEATLRDSAQLGVASALEASGKKDEAIAAYLEVAHRGDKSPYAPFAYNAAARFYEWDGNKDKERQLLQEASRLDPDSVFTKQAQFKLKQMAATMPTPSNVTAPAITSPSTPPVQLAPVTPEK